MRTFAHGFALLLTVGTAALGQEPSPSPSPSPDPELAGKEAGLRERNGALIARLVERTTQFSEEWARLSIEVLKEQSPIDRTRSFDVSVRRFNDGRVNLRLRFREPPALRSVTWLILEPKGGSVRCHKYDPRSRRTSRASAPEWSERLAGTGLTWGDLRGPAPSGLAYTLDREQRLKMRPTSDGEVRFRPVHVLEARLRGGGALVSRVHVDREKRVPLLTEYLRPDGNVTRRRWERTYKRVGEHLRPFAVTIAEAKRTSEVRAEFIKAKAPAAHFDVDRYWLD